MDKEKVEAALDAARRGVLAIMKNEKRQFFEVAKMIKIEFDKKFGGAWHVLVGKHFSAYVTHEAMGKERAGGLIYFHIGQVGCRANCCSLPLKAQTRLKCESKRHIGSQISPSDHRVKNREIS